MKKTTAKKETAIEVVVKEEMTAAQKFVKAAEAIQVENEDDYQRATDILLKVKSNLTRAEEERDKILKPAKEIVKVETARWKPLFGVFDKVRAIVEPKMKGYMIAKETKAKADLAALQKKIDSGSIKKQETVEKNLQNIYAGVPAKTVHTGAGASSMKDIAKMRITNRELIPDEFWVVDEVALRKAIVTERREVPGAELWFDKSLSII